MIIYSDSPYADTGFGNVVRNIVDNYQPEDGWQVFGINHFETDTQYNAYTKVIPSFTVREAMKDKFDPYGYERFSKFLAYQKQPSVVLTVLDPQVAVNVLPALRDYQARGGVWIAYWPVDSHIVDSLHDVVSAPDMPVFYTAYGRGMAEEMAYRQNLKALSQDSVVQLREKARYYKIASAPIVPHGVERSIFRPPSEQERRESRAVFAGDPRYQCDDQTTIFLSVNRNQPRKNYPQLIRVFAQYLQSRPNARLFLHCANQDTMGNIADMCSVYGLTYGRDVVLPAQDEPTLPPDKMNRPYWIGDVFVTTTLGEGWGLTISEAAACGLPVVAPDNTCISEVLAPHSMKFLYDARIPTIIGQWDAYRTRYSGWDEDIIHAMQEASAFKGHHAKAGYEYGVSFDWKEIVGNTWSNLFKAAVSKVRPA